MKYSDLQNQAQDQDQDLQDKDEDLPHQEKPGQNLQELCQDLQDKDEDLQDPEIHGQYLQHQDQDLQDKDDRNQDKNQEHAGLLGMIFRFTGNWKANTVGRINCRPPAVSACHCRSKCTVEKQKQLQRKEAFDLVRIVGI